jgi:DNA polymerase III subunit beta
VLITASAKDLASAARTAAEMSARDSSVPIRTNLLMVARNGCVAFTGTDNIGSMTATAKAATAKAGCVAVDGKVVKLLAGFPENALVEISTVDGAVNVRCGRAQYRIDTLPADQFPTMSEKSEAAEIHLSDADRRRLFATPTAIIPAVDKARPYLCELSVKSVGDRLVACATNGLQIIKTSIAFDAVLPAQGVIVPRQACAVIAKLGSCTIRVGARLIEAFTDKQHFTHRLIEGIFPAYERVIPELSGNIVEIDRRELVAALNRLLLVAVKIKDSPTIATLEWGDVELSLAVRGHKDIAADTLPVISSGSGRTAFPIVDFIRLIDSLSSERIILDNSNPGTAVRIITPGDDDLVVLQVPSRV